MHRILLSLLLLLTAIAIPSCGGSSSTSTGTLKIGLLVPGSASDNGWNQLAAYSLAKLSTDMKFETLTRQQVKQAGAAETIRGFERNGYSLVICHGYEYLEAAQELSDPAKSSAVKLKIAVSGGDVDNPNFQSLLYDLGPASYQLGIIAAKVSKTGKIAFLGGQPFPTVTAMAKGFEAGAKSVNPNITVNTAYTENWDNPTIAKQKTETLLAAGNDVIMQNVDAASSGVFEAIKAHNAGMSNLPGTVSRAPIFAYTFGANSNQNANPICPDHTLASAVIKMDIAFAKVIEQVKAGTFKGGLIRENLTNGTTEAILNPKLKGTIITEETQKLVEEAGKKLANGEIKIP